MSGNVKRSNNPFDGPLSAKSNAAHGVGNNYEDRRRFVKSQTVNHAAPARPARDDYSKVDAAKKTLGLFVANAKYKGGRRLSAEGPYKAPRLDRLENGRAPVAAPAKPPTDPSMIKFLEEVMNRPELHTARSVRNYALDRARARPARPNGTPLSPAANPRRQS
jgi:hypothetical protein